MSIIAAFEPMGAAAAWKNSIAVSVAVGSTTVALTAETPTIGTRQVRIFNSGTNPVWMCPGANCTVPTAGVPANGMGIAAGSVEVLTLPPGTTQLSFNALVAGPALVYITQGEGL